MPIMPALSFRAKLLLTFALLVAGVIGVTLFIAEQKIRSAYQRLSQRQFDTEINYFYERQQSRLETIRSNCLELTQSPRLIEPMAGNDRLELYRIARAEFRGTTAEGSDTNRPPPLRIPSFLSRMALASSIRFLDAEGRVLLPPDTRRPLDPPLSRKQLEEQLALLGTAMGAMEPQQIAYLAPEVDKGRFQLQEMIFTKIVEPEAKRTLGAMVVGFPLFDSGEQDLKQKSQIASGIWLDGRIFSRTIATPVRQRVNDELARRNGGPKAPQFDFILRLDGVPHRVFCRALNPGSAFPTAWHVYLYSLQEQLEEQRYLRTRILGFGAILLAAALGVSLLLARQLAVPIHELADATAEIQKGNFAVRVPERGRDQLGQLARSFNRMAGDLALKEQYRSVLHMVADPEVAEELLANRAVLGGEVREVTVLFCDIRGFSAITQSLPPDGVIRLLNEHMTALTRVVYEHQGVVDKFVGDLLMAVFGAPKSYGNDALNAARCALQMIAARQRLNESAALKVTVGIGIATGRVVAGCMGSSDRVNYTVLGDRVNLAARLGDAAGRMEILIDDVTREKLGGAVGAEELPELRLKGFAEHVRAYRLLGFNPAPAAVPAVAAGPARPA
jgi:class 3 adenylate cyclase